MPKQVHEIVYTLWLNDMEFTCCSRWAYSDPAEFIWNDMEFKTFDSIWDWLYRNSIFWDAYTDYTLFKKRKQIVTYKGNVTARNFKSASITAKVNGSTMRNMSKLLKQGIWKRWNNVAQKK